MMLSRMSTFGKWTDGGMDILIYSVVGIQSKQVKRMNCPRQIAHSICSGTVLVLSALSEALTAFFLLVSVSQE